MAGSAGKLPALSAKPEETAGKGAVWCGGRNREAGGDVSQSITGHSCKGRGRPLWNGSTAGNDTFCAAIAAVPARITLAETGSPDRCGTDGNGRRGGRPIASAAAGDSLAMSKGCKHFARPS